MLAVDKETFDAEDQISIYPLNDGRVFVICTAY
jgi:hypothetical protein